MDANRRRFGGCRLWCANPAAHRDTGREEFDGDSASGRRPGRWSAVVARPGMRIVCARVARVVGYPVPCPTLVPLGLRATPGAHGCRLGIIGAGGAGTCARTWKGWVVGSSEVQGANAGPFGFQHLVISGAPRVVRNPARAIDGPGMFRGSRVQARGRFRARAIHGRLYYVPPKTNDGSAFMGHLVMVWTAGDHTYAYGFHVVATLTEARALDLEIRQTPRSRQIVMRTSTRSLVPSRSERPGAAVPRSKSRSPSGGIGRPRHARSFARQRGCRFPGIGSALDISGPRL